MQEAVASVPPEIEAPLNPLGRRVTPSEAARNSCRETAAAQCPAQLSTGERVDARVPRSIEARKREDAERRTTEALEANSSRGSQARSRARRVSNAGKTPSARRGSPPRAANPPAGRTRSSCENPNEAPAAAETRTANGRKPGSPPLRSGTPRHTAREGAPVKEAAETPAARFAKTASPSPACATD